MSAVISWIKKELVYLKDSFPEILKGFVFFALSVSGFAVGLLLRTLGFDGYIILFGGIITAIFATIILYLFFKKYLKTEESGRPPQKKEKRNKKKDRRYL
ncbi:MAG: hypothetical protein ACTSR8_18925 [Promethearchaeota archaeon]